MKGTGSEMTNKSANPLLQKPVARSGGLLVEELDGETLIYDVKSHDAHCLNESALLVWEACDGTVTVEGLVQLLDTRGFPEAESLVWMTLERLSRSGLFEDEIAMPEQGVRYSRKEAMRMMGRAAGLALAAPLVTSIVAPLAAQAGSCIDRNACRRLRAPNCTGLPICNRRNRCCVVDTGGGGRSRCRPRPC